MSDDAPKKTYAPARRDERGRLLPGGVNNPRGRPPTGMALAEMLREAGGAHERLMAMSLLAYDIALGLPIPVAPLEWHAERARRAREGLPPPPMALADGTPVEVRVPTIQQMLAAMAWIGPTGFQRPAVSLDITSAGQPAADYQALTQDELDALEVVRLRVLARHAAQGALPDPEKR
jgi:hypothetical protein